MKRIRKRGSPGSPVYEARTREIVVRVITSYLPHDSQPLESKYAWGYMVEIENHGKETVQLISRHWVITDGLNRVEEVRGEGVVGEQPTLGPREAFRYTSGCPLTTPSGTMRGAYQMVTSEGETFEAEIPEFSLHLPEATRRVN